MLTFNFEETYFLIAEKSTQNVLIIADRRVMDASAVIAKEAWDRNRKKLNLEEIKISDNRNNYAVYRRHFGGAEKFFTIEDHSARLEGIELAWDRKMEDMEAWRDHPTVDIINNRSNFSSQNQPCCEEDWYLRGRQYRWRYILIKQRVIFISVFF